jgi:hypothetical protein
MGGTLLHSWKPGWRSRVNTLDFDTTGFTFSDKQETKRVDFGAIRSGYWFQAGSHGAGIASLQLNGDEGKLVDLSCSDGWLGGEPVKFRKAVGSLLRALAETQPQLEITLGGSSRERLRTLAVTVPGTIAIVIYGAWERGSDIGATIAVGAVAVTILFFIVYRMYGGSRRKRIAAHELADAVSGSS